MFQIVSRTTCLDKSLWIRAVNLAKSDLVARSLTACSLLTYVGIHGIVVQHNLMAFLVPWWLPLKKKPPHQVLGSIPTNLPTQLSHWSLLCDTLSDHKLRNNHFDQLRTGMNLFDVLSAYVAKPKLVDLQNKRAFTTAYLLFTHQRTFNQSIKRR